MRILVLLAAALLVPQEKNEAEALFKKMEEKLAKAKTIQFSFKVTLEGDEVDDDFKGAIEGTLWLAQANRLRMEVALPKRKVILISDGTNLAGSKDGYIQDSTPTPPSLNGHLVRAICHGGLSVGALPWLNHIDENREDKDAGVTASTFKRGAAEGGAQAVEFEVAKTDEEGKAVKTGAIAWLDEKTGLPAKFVVPKCGRHFFGKNLKITETYSGFKLDAEIPAAKFEWPKETK